jgi:hypothetical protein
VTQYFRNEHDQALPGKLFLELKDFLLGEDTTGQDYQHVCKPIEVCFDTLSSYFTIGWDIERMTM